MIIQTDFIGKNWGYYVINDETNYYNDVVAEEGFEFAKEFFNFEHKIFNSQKEVPPNSYASSILESIGQSDNCPPQLYTEDYEIKISIISM